MRAGARASAAALTGTAAVLALVVAPATLAVPAAAASRPGTSKRAAAGSGATAQGGGTPSAAPGPAARRLVGGPRLASGGVVVNYPSRRSRQLPKVPASAYVIADANTGQVLAAKDPHGQFAPASTLKVLTAITLIPRLSPDAMVLATRRAADTQPNDVGLIAGRHYKVSNLFTALLTISANDAAVALTQAAGGGSLARGMALINAEAHRLQAYDVVAKQPNGLPAAGQVVSAYDEALIARQALATPAFMRYDSTVSARFLVKPRHWVTLVNQNTLLTQYRGGIGGKIGWTVKSEATYIGLARRHGVTLIVTVLHCTPLQEITTGERLLNWGFAMAGRVRPVGTLVPSLQAIAARHRAAAAKAARSERAARAERAKALQAEARSDGGSTGAALAVGAAVVVLVALCCAGLLRARRRHAIAQREWSDWPQ